MGMWYRRGGTRTDEGSKGESVTTWGMRHGMREHMQSRSTGSHSSCLRAKMLTCSR